jgi:hypothetical protein
MPAKSYAIEQNGPKRLTVSWKFGWRDTTVSLDGQTVGVIPNQKALQQGQTFALPDGSQIFVRLVSRLSGTELEVMRNGQPMPGSASDPQSRLKAAYQITYFIAGLNLLLGVLSLLIKSEFLQTLSYWPVSIAFGLVFLALGFLTQRRSSVALIAAIVIFALDGLLGIYLAMTSGGTPGVGGVLVRVLLLIPMVQGVGAIKALKAQEGQSVISQVM